MKLKLLENECVIRDGNGNCVINHVNRIGTWYITNKRICFNAIPNWKLFFFGLFSYMTEGTAPLISINLEDILSLKKEDKLLGTFYNYKLKSITGEVAASFNTDAPMWIKELIREISLYTNNQVFGDEQAFEIKKH